MKDALKGISIPKLLLHIFIYSIECLVYYLVPLLISEYLNENATLDRIYFFTAVFIVVNVLRIVIRIITKRFSEVYLVNLSYLVSNNVSKKILSSDIKNLSDKGTGYINSIINKYNLSIDKIMEMLVFYIPDAIIAIAVFVYASMAKALILGISFLFTLIISTVIYTYLQRKQEKYMEIYNKEQANYTKHYVDYIINLRTVKLLKLDNYIEDNLKEKTNSSVKAFKSKLNIECFKEILIRVLTFIPIIMGIMYGITEFKNGQSGIGTILFFVMISGDLRFIVKFIGEISKSFSEYKVAKNNLNECAINDAQKEYIQTFDKVEIRNLKFKYDSSKFEIIVDEFSASKSENVAIIGKSGQGKTTILNILSKTIKTDNVYIDGKLTDSNIAFSYVTQEAEMFNTTIRENLCLDKNISDEYIFKLFDELSLNTWYNSLENGLDTEIGEKGIKLSTGQKQRLNLVRAILQDKDAYILDEPTSNLDETTEEKVVLAINKYLGHKTLIIVTHREKVLDICDKVYKIQEHKLSRIK